MEITLYEAVLAPYTMDDTSISPPMFGPEGRSGKSVIYDTYRGFTESNAWEVFDLQSLDEQLTGFEGGVFDGQYVYFAPMNFENAHGKMPRYRSTPKNGLSYALVYNQNSSSFGSVLQRPTFQVGTESGLRTVSLANEMNLADGNWHQILATYDGSALKIYVDGVLNNSAKYATPADLSVNDADIGIGAEVGSLNSFDGFIDKVSIWNVALNDQDILQHLSCSSHTGHENGLVGYWPFDEKEGKAVYDLSINQNDGQLINQVSWATTEFLQNAYAGPRQEVCSNDVPFQLGDFYPVGGTWSGNGVDSSGLFTPSVALEGSTQRLTYSYQDEGGCIYTSLKTVVIFPVTPQPKIVITNQRSLCDGGSMTLTVEKDFDHYAGPREIQPEVLLLLSQGVTPSR
jgi:hypothetical protein